MSDFAHTTAVLVLAAERARLLESSSRQRWEKWEREHGSTRGIASLKSGDRVRNRVSGWTGTLVADPVLKGAGNNKVKVRWDQNGHVGWTSLNSQAIEPLHEGALLEDLEFEGEHPRGVHGRFVRKIGGEVRHARRKMSQARRPGPSGRSREQISREYVDAARHAERHPSPEATRRVNALRDELAKAKPSSSVPAKSKPLPPGPDVSGGTGVAGPAPTTPKRKGKAKALPAPKEDPEPKPLTPEQQKARRKEIRAATRATERRRRKLRKGALGDVLDQPKQIARTTGPKPPPAPAAMKRVRKPTALGRLKPGDEIRVDGRHLGVFVGRIGGLKTPRVHVYLQDTGEHRYVKVDQVTHYRHRDDAMRANLLDAARRGADPDSPHERRVIVAMGDKPRRRTPPAPVVPRGESDRMGHGAARERIPIADVPAASPVGALVDPTPRPSGLVHDGEELLTSHPHEHAHPRHLRPGDGVLFGAEGSNIGGNLGTVLGHDGDRLVVFQPSTRTTHTVEHHHVHHVQHLDREERLDALDKAPRGRAADAIAKVKREKAVERLVDREGYPAWFRNPAWQGAPAQQGGRITRWPQAPGDKPPLVGETPIDYAEKNWVRGGEPGQVVRTSSKGLLPSTPHTPEVRKLVRQLDSPMDKGAKSADVRKARRAILDRLWEAPDSQLEPLSRDDMVELWNWSVHYSGYEDITAAIERVWKRRGFKESAYAEHADAVLCEALGALGMPISPRLRRRWLKVRRRRMVGLTRKRSSARTARKLRRDGMVHHPKLVKPKAPRVKPKRPVIGR